MIRHKPDGTVEVLPDLPAITNKEERLMQVEYQNDDLTLVADGTTFITLNGRVKRPKWIQQVAEDGGITLSVQQAGNKESFHDVNVNVNNRFIVPIIAVEAGTYYISPVNSDVIATVTVTEGVLPNRVIAPANAIVLGQGNYIKKRKGTIDISEIKPRNVLDMDAKELRIVVSALLRHIQST